MVAGWLQESGFRHGSPITTILLEEAPGNPAVTAAGREAYAAWVLVLANRPIADGVPDLRARRVARLIMAALEGALVHARVEQSAAPLFEVATELQQLAAKSRS